MLDAKPCQSNIDDTLETLNHQQNERLSRLIDNLLEQQQDLINTLLSSQYQSELNASVDVKPELQNLLPEFNNLLIKGKLISPIDSITQRMQLTEDYLNKKQYQYKKNMPEEP